MSTQRFSINDIQLGMFVTQVTRQTGELTIKTQGLIKSERLLEQLRQKGVQEVEVDLARSVLEQGLELNVSEQTTESPKAISASPANEDPMAAIEQAGQLYDKARTIQSRFVKKLKKGALPPIGELTEVSADIIDSVFDNADAISLLTQIKDREQYLMEHSLNCSILMAMFARQMGFDKATIDELGLAGLLMDAGMATLPEDILNQRGKLSDQERTIVESHVDVAVDLLEQSEHASDTVLDVVQNHHERLDGSGYPNGKQGDEISVYARMAAIVDSYDALTADRPYRKSLNATQALKRLLSTSQGQLDQSLVQQFIRCIGVHPVGSLVKLKSEKLAIVIKANKDDPLKPKVASFYSVRSGHYKDVRILDLTRDQDDIEACVRPEEFKINLARFFREVLLGRL
ncbi:uncharacterized protein HMF8227_00789 [Saliniradius amylolyticus]|uniref:HD-GYP domain-containing protein n=1 Tax=Saliniradius amylolyticus TaxID=2183582 RepID=A0A2S2E0W0_9ALTE|nr:HD-GYP domain-containing protein [Saliniradius amylolyticus]AWL11285.1 uncharacterized protein HMF8227_00789 [Saliniradius amylolyticus]